MNDPLVQQVAATLKAGGPGPSSRVTVGLSGGIDSVVLLHVLRALAAAGPWPVVCVVAQPCLVSWRRPGW